MKKFILLSLYVFILAGCTSNDLELMPKTQLQKHDLNDYDKDGVIAAREKCKETIEGAEINNYGCGKETLKKAGFNLNVQFDNDSAKLKPNYYSEIGKLANVLEQYPEINISIEGHCSLVGYPDYNLSLSQRRAESVMSVLVNDFEIDPKRLEAIGYGYNKPLVDEKTEAANKLNRRVFAKFNINKATSNLKWHIYTDKGLNPPRIKIAKSPQDAIAVN